MSLRDLHILEDVKPIGGGWRYMQTQVDGTLTRIPLQGSAVTAGKLVEAVRQYRINEGINIGDPERDIAEYIKKVSPNNDRFRGKGGALNQPREVPHVPLIQKVSDWLKSLGPTRPRLVSIHDATDRGQICVGCPQNIRWKTHCTPCNEKVEYDSISIRGSTTHPLDDALHACRLHAVHLPCAIFIDEDNLPHKQPNAPEFCWMKSGS